MTSIDPSGFLSGLQALRQQLQAAVVPVLEAGAAAAVAGPPAYAEPVSPETSGLDDRELLSDVYPLGSGGAIDIAVVYDWVMSPNKQHCASADGLDCPTFAANGPYTSATVPARPGDGTTPCGDHCGCELVERPPSWDGAEEAVAEAMAAELSAQLAGG